MLRIYKKLELWWEVVSWFFGVVLFLSAEMSITRLDARTAKLIGSSIVISSVYSVIKELLENAIDAGATSINISLEKYGLNRIEVRDNGSGICHADIPLACLAGHTSKIQDYSDLDHLQSYGFRGQALNALCTVADLSFTTRTSDDDVATTYTVDKEGRIISSGPSYLGVGTTVVVRNLFVNLPVRRKMLSRSPSSLRTILWLLRCYSIAKPNLSLSLVHDGNLVWRKSTAHALTSAIQETLGYKLAILLHQMYWKGSYKSFELSSEEEIDEDLEVEMDILVPKKGSNISEFCSTQTVEGIVLNEYLIINGRPVKHKKVEKLMTVCIGKGQASEFPNRKKPPWVLRLNIPPHQLDVNLESDKTKVFLRCEEVILHALEDRILTYYGIQESNADPSSQSSEKKPIKKKLEATKPVNQPQPSVTSDSPLYSGTGGHDSNDLESPHCILSFPPPPKQARIEVDELNPSCAPDSGLDGMDPTKNSQPFFSLEPFEISDSQVSEISSPEIVESSENVLDVSPLKNIAEESGLGSFRIEILKKSEDFCIEKEKSGSGELNMNERSGSDSTKSNKEELQVAVESSSKDKSELGSGDEEVINEALNMMNDNENEFDLDDWSRGKISANGVIVEEPVKILQSKPSLQLSSEAASAVEPIAGIMEISPSPIKKPEKAVSSEKSSPEPFSMTSKQSNLRMNNVASPFPNAISQLGRQDMRGFDCFASITRPKIIAEQPGILFTNVASELAKRWEALSDEERADYKKEALKKVAARPKTTEPELVGDRSLPKKTAQKLPVILSDRNKQETLMKKVVKEKEVCSIPDFARTMNASITEIRHKVKKRDESDPEKQPEKVTNEKVFLIGQLKPSGMWVYKQDEDIGILRHFAIQELVVYQKLMASLSIPIRPLTVPIVFDEMSLGSELWRIFMSLGSRYDVIKQQTVITSELIVRNGFQISILSGDGENESSGLITGIASVFSPYGVDDLKEVLQMIDSSDGTLSNCRTLQISSYIESEAIRMCRQSSPIMPKDDVLTLLAQWDGRPKCLHSLPVLFPFDYSSVQQCDIYPVGS